MIEDDVKAIRYMLDQVSPDYPIDMYAARGALDRIEKLAVPCDDAKKAALDAFEDATGQYTGSLDKISKWVEIHGETIRQSLCQTVPEGWKLVPITPTNEMVGAFDDVMATPYETLTSALEAMLNAAPEPEKTP